MRKNQSWRKINAANDLLKMFLVFFFGGGGKKKKQKKKQHLQLWMRSVALGGFR